jgi:hypothetical protein
MRGVNAGARQNHTFVRLGKSGKKGIIDVISQ